MQLAELYDRVAARMPRGGLDVSAVHLVQAVLESLAERLTPEEAAEIGVELPDELGDILATANGDGELEHDEFIEDVAARLDLDDDDAEAGVKAVLKSIREAIEPMVSIEQVLET